MLLFFLSAIALVFPGELSGEVWVKRDLHRHFLPGWNFAVESVRAGHLPFWNPYIFGGSPALATLSACVLYPPMIFLHVVGVFNGVNWLIVLHLAFAALGVYLWTRRWGVGFAGSVAAGLSYSLSGSMLASINCTINLFAAAYFPYFMMALRRLLAKPDLRGAALFALCQVMMFLAGDPSVLYGSMLVAGSFALYRFVEERAERKVFRSGIFWGPALATVLFLGLAAFQILPLVEYIGGTDRMRMGLREATAWSVAPSDLISLVVPFWNDLKMPLYQYYVKQNFYDNLYAGIVTLFFAAAALRFAPRDRRVRLSFLLMLLSLLLVMGKNSLFYGVYYAAVPLAKIFRYPVRFFFLVNFAIACLAGLGLDAFLAACKSGRKMEARFLLIFSMVFASVPLIAWNWDKVGFLVSRIIDIARMLSSNEGTQVAFISIAGPILHNVGFACFIASILFLGVFFIIRKKIRAGFGAFLCVLLLFVDLRNSNTGFEPHLDRASLLKPTPNIEWLMKQPGPYRVAPSPRIFYKYSSGDSSMNNLVHNGKDRLGPNFNMVYRIPIIAGYESHNTKDFSYYWFCYFLLRDPAKTSALDAAGIRYVIVDPRVKNVSPVFKLAHAGKAADLYEYKDALPRAFLSDSAIFMRNNRLILFKIIKEKLDFRKAIFIRLKKGETGPALPVVDAAEPPGRADIRRYEDLEVVIETETGAPRWLYLSDSHDVNWRAEVNGRPQKIYKANGLFRAVPVPAGKSTVRFYYYPGSFYAGCGVSAAVLAGLLVALWLRRPRVKRL